MAFRDNAKEYFEQTDYYKELTDNEKTEFLDIVTSNRREFLNFLDNEPNFQELNLDERKEFLSVIDPQNYAVEPEPVATPELTLSVPERAQDKLAITDPWDKPISNVVKRTVGALADFAAGALQLGSDFTARAVSDSALDVMQVPPEKREEVRKNLANESAVNIHAITQNMDSTIAALRGATKKLFQDTEEYKQGLDTKGQFIYDNTVNIIDALPTIAAAVYSGGAAAFATGLSRAVSSKYGRAREAGYEPSESLAISSVPGLVAGVGAALNTKIALDVSKPLMRKLFYNLAADQLLDFSAPMVEFFADYATDNFYQTNQGDLLAENDTVDKAFYRSLWNAATGIGASTMFTTAPHIAMKAKMWANGLKQTTTKDGQVIVHPVEMTDMVDGLVDKGAFDGVDAQKTFNDTIGSMEAGKRTAQKIAEIEEVQQSRPLDELDIDPQVGPSKKLGRLKVDMEVDVSPKYFSEMDSKPRNMGKPAKIIKTTYPVEEPTLVIPPGGVAPIESVKKNYFVDVEFPDEPGVTYTIPRKHIVEKTRTPNSVPFESARLVRFMSDLLRPQNIPMSSWTWDNARMALGGFLGVRESMSRKALGGVKGTTGGLVWDAMRNNPEDASRILSHEAGHIFAEADADVLKSMNIPEFDGFKQWVKQATESADADVLNRYEQAKKQTPELALEDFVLTEKYGDELTKLWNDWSLFKSKTPNAKELAANALSVYMNDVMGGEAIPGFRASKIRADLSDWVNSQPNLKLAFEGLRAYDFAEPGSLNAELTSMFREADRATVEAEKAKRGMDKTFLQELGDNLQDRLYSFLDRMKNDPAAIERRDKNLMTPGRAAHFVDVGYGETLRTLLNNGISPEDYKNVLFWERIIGDRTKTVERLSGESQYKDMGKYREAFEFESQRIRDEIVDNNPDFTDTEVERAVQAHMQQFAESEIVQEHVSMLNPKGFTQEDAAKGLAEIEARIGPEKMQVIQQRKAAEHQAFKDWVIPVLRESKLFSERQLLHMEDNQDYATFVVAHHAFNAKRSKGAKGSLDYVHEQLGTLGYITDPHAAMTMLRARMVMAADQAGMTRDLIEMSSQFEAENYPGEQRTKLLSPGENIPAGYEEFKSRKYNNATGRVEDVRYAVRKGSIDGFFNAAETSTLLSGLSTIHGTMKGWMTIYNPKFWFTNFVRDVARTAINAPGFSALYKIPTEAARALAEDLKYKAKGAENPAYRQMLIDAQLAGDVRAQHTSDKVMSPSDRVMLMADMNPEFFGKTWGEIDGFMNKLRYAYAKTTEPWKKASAFIGGSVEFASKAAMKRYLDKNYSDMTQAEKNWYIRNAAGTPVLGRSGSWNPYLSNMLLFYNPNMQGIAGDWQAFKKNPIENSLKRMATIAPYMMLIAAARSGMLNEDLKKWAEGIPSAFFGRGFVLPTGFSADGDSGAFIVPTDPATRALLAASYQAVNKMQNGTFSPTDIGGSILGEAAEGLPSVTPVAKTIQSGYQYLTGENPQDFMGRPAIDPTVFASDKDWQKRAAMMTHFAQQGWGGPLNALGFTNMARMQLETRTPKPRVSEQTAAQIANTAIKDLTGVPVIGYPLGGLFKFTSAGIRELAEDRASATQKAFNSDRDTVRRVLNNLLEGGQPTPEELLLMTDERHQRFVDDFLKDTQEQKAIAALNRPDLLQPVRLLQQNPNRDVKMELIRIIAERLKKK